ncbi:MAG TPA: BatD family protein [Phycisphaerae bacterium]|nr:BatD family protein [Phycisphaerae bacterium]
MQRQMSNYELQITNYRGTPYRAFVIRNSSFVIRNCASIVLVASLCASPVLAQSLTAEISSDDAFVGEALTVNVTVSNPSQATAPTPPVTEDFEINLASVEPVGRSINTVIGSDGRLTQQTSYTYKYIVKPLRPGRLTLGRFTLREKGRSYFTHPIPVSVSNEKTTRDLFCEVKTKRDVAYIGQPVELTYEIWIRRFHQPGVGMLDVSPTWNLKDIQSSTWGVFSQNDIARPKYAAQQREAESGRPEDFYVFYLEATIYPTKAGPFDFGDIQFVYNYPIRIGRNVFNLTLERSRKISARPTLPKLLIKPIPTVGRPPDYNGAIGVYSLSAIAKPLQVPVGDPITLTLSIRGAGPLERLTPPRLDQVAALTRNFEVSTDVPAGVLENDRKRFTLTIRALREDVKEIPPVPLSFFNPDTGKFETAYSRAIPLKVTPAQRIALSNLPPSEGGGADFLTPLVETTEGLFPNETNSASLLADQSADLGPFAWSLIALLPLAYGATSVWCARSDRFRRDQAYRRRAHALSNAKKSLAVPQASSLKPQAFSVRAALVGYIADCCNVPAGGLTRADAVKLLADRRVSAETVNAADALLEKLELAEYAGAAQITETDGASTAMELIQRLERERLR